MRRDSEATPSEVGAWQDVPGARWLRADLHIHTIDDAPRDLPHGLVGDRNDDEVLRSYAHRLLDAAIDQKIEVLGLTPHSAFVEPGVSAVLDVRDVWWNETSKYHKKPFRDLIFAVYPGFEPSFVAGKRGLHLLFLFDPAVSRSAYQSAWSAVMRGKHAYDPEDQDDPTGQGPIERGHRLNRTAVKPLEVFENFNQMREVGRHNWLCIAAHPMQDNGLLSFSVQDIKDLVGTEGVLGYELTRSRPAEDQIREGKLKHYWETGRAMLYSSDANDLPHPGQAARERELGNRYTLLKLASPTIGALRQALLARDSRIRLPFRKSSDGSLVESDQLPEALPLHRPWIRQVSVKGGLSFHRDLTFRFSPDLTCVIGGSMTGKSTLLDGLRVHLQSEAELPPASSPIGRSVRERAKDRFLAGAAVPEVESPAGDASQPLARRSSFRYRFYAQGELEELSRDNYRIEELIFRLAPGMSEHLLKQRDELTQEDEVLAELIESLVRTDSRLANADQQRHDAEQARTAMLRYKEAGADDLPPLQRRLSDLSAALDDLRTKCTEADTLCESLQSLSDSPVLKTHGGESDKIKPSIDAAILSSQMLKVHLEQAVATITAMDQQTQSELKELTRAVTQRLVAAGGKVSDLHDFESYARRAQHYESLDAALHQIREERKRLAKRFQDLRTAQRQKQQGLRQEAQDICRRIHDMYQGQIAVAITPEGDASALNNWIVRNRQPGLTRWWNSVRDRVAISTDHLQGLADAAQSKDPDAETKFLDISRSLEMSDAVARSLREKLTDLRSRSEFRAMRFPDTYQLRWQSSPTESVELHQLSGGRKIAVLLTLVLDAEDNTPLIIDQPEDQLDNRWINETIVAALRRLKGRRQVILATHNANLVVNGDADQVIALEASAERAHIQVQGAIEEEAVRRAIVEILDGGEAAFQLRKQKYGF